MVLSDNSGVAEMTMNSVFPKVAALAGKKKDKKVPRGWITYQNKSLLVCTGKVLPPKRSSPLKGTAWDGLNQFKPEPDAILFSVNIGIRSIHQLLCAVEGLLTSL